MQNLLSKNATCSATQHIKKGVEKIAKIDDQVNSL